VKRGGDDARPSSRRTLYYGLDSFSARTLSCREVSMMATGFLRLVDEGKQGRLQAQQVGAGLDGWVAVVGQHGDDLEGPGRG
jgi:hypothetical protein